MSDALGIVLTLLAFVVPIALAWFLVGRSRGRPKPPAPRGKPKP